MKNTHPRALRARAQGAVAVLGCLLGLLAFTFFRVQVVGGGAYALQAESNRLRALPIPASRGTILDRHGRVIADNVPGYAVTLLYDRIDSARATLDRLAPYLDLDEEAVERLIQEARRFPGQPLIVDRNATDQAVARIDERRPQFPDVFIDMRPKRRYVEGEAFSHVIGYIGEITADELEDPVFAEAGYEQGMLVGKGGIERQYEQMLQGEPGVRYVEVDAVGRIVGDFGGSVFRASTAGQDIQLSLDLELQAFIHEIFPKNRTGAVVALDPADGGVLALYSWPTFNSNDFVGGISRARWEGLVADPQKPLFDRAVQGKFPPASTFKPLTAAIALDLGVITGNERMPYPCLGGISLLGRYARCWSGAGHGSLDLVGAIANSCNVYFYQLGQKIGLDRLLERGLALGLSEPCDIDLPGERAGTFPESREFWTRMVGWPATPVEVLSLAIGQGPNQQTPLKMAQYYMALARDGSAPAPTLYPGRTDDPHGWELDLSPEFLELEREGLRRVTRTGGTAVMSQLELWDLMGKTGSGENTLSRLGLAETDAWFAGMAGPLGGPPEIVIVAMVEHGGGGSTTAAPIAAKAADFYLRRKHGVPLAPLQTLREHINAGVWPSWAR